MYPFIVCFCGRSVGDNFDLYKAIRAQKYAEALGDADIDIDPSLLSTMDAVNIDMSEILDALGYDLDCCRTRLTTQVEFKEVY